jgi:nicotinamidase-related amidase
MHSWRDIMPGESYSSFDTPGTALPSIGQRPALLVIDVVKSFLGEQGMTLEQSVVQWPLSCGPAGWAALPKLQGLIGAARSNSVPVIYTVGDPSVLGGATKPVGTNPGKAQAGAQDIPEQLRPAEGEAVIPKAMPSAFFGTALTSLLVRLKVDSLIVSGCTTSGCVRATVVDGHSHGWSVVVAEDASFDRAELSHNVSLFEMNAKYATVSDVHQISQSLASLAR